MTVYTNDPNFYLKSLIEKIFDLKKNNLFINRKLYKNFIPLIENFKEKEEEKYNVLMNYLYLKKYKYKSFKEIFSNGVPEYEDLLLLYNNKKENVEFLKKLMVSRELTR